ncbi:MAG TPA: hypothetical protein VHV83_17480 [Armatimonadota bacterium]|nr:hypothetical protein [Armatimonadota bacterium]
MIIFLLLVRNLCYAVAMQWSSWHNHTGDGRRFSYCADADMTAEYYRQMLRAGTWHAFAITEHAFALAIPPDEQPWPGEWYHRPDRLWNYRAFREEKTEKFLDRIGEVCDGERIFSGLEVEIACDGSLSMESLLWPYLDVVIGSIHYLPGEKTTWCEAHIAQLDSLLRYPIDVLGHPFRELSHAGPVPDEIIDETLRRAQQAGVAVEINAHMPFDRDPEVLKRAVDLDLQISFGLDAHHRHELELHTYFQQVVDQSGVNVKDIRMYRPVRRSPKPRHLVR